MLPEDFYHQLYNHMPGKTSMSETAKYSSWIWHKGGGGRLSKTGANRPVRKLTHFVRNCHILSVLVTFFVTCGFHCVLRWGMSTLVWNLTGWSGLESLTSRFLFQLLFFWKLSLITISSWDFATNTTWWTPAWCWTSHQMWRIKRASIVPILSEYHLDLW